jgi:hypothetical protein
VPDIKHATYMILGSSQTTQQGRASLGLDVEQLTVMATAGSRTLPQLEALLSLGFFDVSAELRQHGPGAGIEVSFCGL